MRPETVVYHLKREGGREGKEKEVVALACNSQHLKQQVTGQAGLKTKQSKITHSFLLNLAVDLNPGGHPGLRPLGNRHFLLNQYKFLKGNLGVILILSYDDMYFQSCGSKCLGYDGSIFPSNPHLLLPCETTHHLVSQFSHFQTQFLCFSSNNVNKRQHQLL